jgi:hypothetical protein
LVIVVEIEEDGQRFRLSSLDLETIRGLSPCRTGISIFISTDTIESYRETQGSDFRVTQVPLLLAGVTKEVLRSNGYERFEYRDATAHTTLLSLEI